MSEHDMLRPNQVPNPYEAIAAGFEEAAQRHAANLEAGYTQAVGRGEEQGHELHSEGLADLWDGVMHSRSEDLDFADQEIGRIDSRLQNPILRSDEIEDLNSKKQEWSDLVAEDAAVHQEAINDFTKSLRIEASDKSHKKIADVDTYDYWTSDASQAEQTPEKSADIPKVVEAPEIIPPTIESYPAPKAETDTPSLGDKLKEIRDAIVAESAKANPDTGVLVLAWAMGREISDQASDLQGIGHDEGYMLFHQSVADRLAKVRQAQAERAAEQIPIQPENGPGFNIEVGEVYQPEYDNDRMIVDRENGIFAVFDGVGAGKEAGVAAGVAAQKVHAKLSERTSTSKDENVDMVKEALVAANQAIREMPEAGDSTAVVTKLFKGEDGRTYVAFASVGDSRLYVLPRPGSGPLFQVTKDEGYRNVITNSVGRHGIDIQQSGFFWFKEGETLMLCSDGVTGDYGSQLLSDEEIEQALSGPTSQEAAEELVKISRKTDDTTAIVVKF